MRQLCYLIRLGQMRQLCDLGRLVPMRQLCHLIWLTQMRRVVIAKYRIYEVWLGPKQTLAKNVSFHDSI